MTNGEKEVKQRRFVKLIQRVNILLNKTKHTYLISEKFIFVYYYVFSILKIQSTFKHKILQSNLEA